MKEHIIQVDTAHNCYNIVIGTNLLTKIPSYLQTVNALRRVCIVCDEALVDLYLDSLKTSLENVGAQLCCAIIQSGEKSKSMDNMQDVMEKFLTFGLERKDLLLCLGGGVVGDLGGVCASLLLRGISYVQIPTTLLAQVDSSVGGKTGVNSRSGKNLIGSFYQPQMVITDIDVLRSLPKRELMAGYAEIVKYGLINDAVFFEYLEKNLVGLKNLDGNVLTTMIKQSCLNKADIVSQDTHEKGVRALLNLGHSFGHALEAICGYDGSILHGEAVAVGMVLAARYSQRCGFCESQEVKRIEAHLRDADFTIELSAYSQYIHSAQHMVDFMYKDKKNMDGKIRLILLKGIGKSFIYDDANPQDMCVFLEQQLSH